jgi:hypothetical protein
LKLANCTHGHTMKFLVRPGTYACSRRAFTEDPSRYAIDDRKRPMLTGAKRNWSQATRARIVPLTDDVLTYFVRTPYQVVAAGPKMTGRGVSW